MRLIINLSKLTVHCNNIQQEFRTLVYNYPHREAIPENIPDLVKAGTKEMETEIEMEMEWKWKWNRNGNSLRRRGGVQRRQTALL